MKTFAVIIPTLNEEVNLDLLLKDIQAQSMKPTQIIVADAYSTDQTRAVAAKYGALVVDGGLPGPGRNAGARAATTDYLFFLDADVRIFDTQFFEKAVPELETRNLGIATAELIPMSRRLDDRLGHWVYNRILHIQKLYNPIAAGSLMIASRATHDAIHGFDEAITLGEDTNYTLRAAKVASFGILKSVTISVSVRRYERDGRWRIAGKYILAGIYQAILGPIKHNRFKYEFGYDHMKSETDEKK